MKRLIAILILVTIVFYACDNDASPDPYLITKNSIGMLSDSTELRDLDIIFEDDSIVKYSESKDFMADINDIDIYSKDGKKKLTLSLANSSDSTSVVESVQIFDSNYKTAKKVSISSTYKDISDNYKISKINNLINSIVISVNEINASFTIDKSDLPANLRYDMGMKIEKSQIPDDTKIKYFMIHW